MEVQRREKEITFSFSVQQLKKYFLIKSDPLCRKFVTWLLFNRQETNKNLTF